MTNRAWLSEYLDQQLLPAIERLSDNAYGRKRCQQLAKDLREFWVEQGKSTLRQQQGLMDQTRRTIKDEFGDDHFSLEYIKFTRDESFELNRQKQSSARSRQLQQGYLKDPDAIVAKAVALLESPEWSDIACGLAVLTGRRLNEVLKTGEFEIQSQWIVSFSGALKRRREAVPLVFDIPTLTTAQKVVNAVQNLRQIIPPEANENLVAQKSDLHFADLVPLPAGKERLYSHLWRSVFCCIATFWYCPKHVDDLLFKAHIMGHFESFSQDEKLDDLKQQKRLETFSSERHYRLFEIDDSLIAQHNGKRKGIKLGVGGIVPIHAFLEGLPQSQPQTAEPKQPSTLRVWKEDLENIDLVLQHFDGKTNADRLSQLINWSLDRLNNPEQYDLEETKTMKTHHLHEELPVAATPNPKAITPETPTTKELAVMFSKVLNSIDQLTQTLAKQQPNPPSISPPVTTHPSANTEQQPKNSKRRYKTGEADQIINSAINAIIRYNDQPDLLHDQKWAITINGLKKYRNDQRAVTRAIQERQEEIDTHHQRHLIQPNHNNRHKKHDITQIIPLISNSIE